MMCLMPFQEMVLNKAWALPVINVRIRALKFFKHNELNLIMFFYLSIAFPACRDWHDMLP